MNILLFRKKAVIFKESGKNPFLGPKSLLRGRKRLATKMNIPFFMGNKVLNIFSFNNFFEKSNIFGENEEKKFGGTWPFFRRRDLLTSKTNITFLSKIRY